MSDQVRMSLNNALVVIGLVLSGGIAYGSIQVAHHALSKRVTKAEQKIDNLQDDITDIEKAREADRVRDEYMAQALVRIEEWIKEIDSTEIVR